MIKKTTYGYTIENNNVFLDIVFYGDDIVRFSYSKENKLPKTSIAVIAKPKKIDCEIENNNISTDKLKINIDEETLKVSIYDKNGNLLNKDKNLDLNNISLEKFMNDEKGFYGMGEKFGFINQIDTDTVNWNNDVLANSDIHTSIIKEYHTAVPFYIGLKEDLAYGIYFDNTFKTHFDFGKEKKDRVKFKADGGRIDYFFIYGPEISNVVRNYSYITGRMPLPRKDFLGYHQCRWSYENKEELLEVARRMKKENIPCDVLYLDIDYMKDYKVFTIDDEKFSEFKEMNDELKQMGFKLVVIIDPGVKKEEGYKVFDEGKEKDYFIKDKNNHIYIGEVWPGDSAFPDFLRNDVKKWWGELHKELIDLGVEGIWNDMNEPADFSTDSKTLPLDTIHIDNDGNERAHSEIHNIYAMLEAEASYKGLKEIDAKKRPFILTRAAFAGTQRYSALWTGDNESVWEHLEASIPMYLNLSLSGFSFIGGDVGGFNGDSNGELLTRWTQLGAFTPFFRNHSAKGTINQEPWCFGRDYLKVIKDYISLRYKFMTYLYNLMRDNSLTGEPVLRPLFYHYQEDEKTYDINNQFLYGENIMICPITKPRTYKRMVYLPEGKWYDYFTKEIIEGGKYIIADAPLEKLPIYIKAGAIIPIDNNGLEIHYYYGLEGKYKLYIDDSLSFDYEKGKYSEVELNIKPDTDNIIVKGQILKDGYEFPNIKIVIHGFVDASKVTIDGDELNFNKEKELYLNINK
ncbi:MAG: glycoside hydrolase family 31 protein [Senegalia sp. (in: firmicutes)]|uniref:glycoside hydrolase family 31 protein n=1 Tax=Senegalia sp. (in: firmicutes) TaxID=1924098 RepID=UPI003F96A997